MSEPLAVTWGLDADASGKPTCRKDVAEGRAFLLQGGDCESAKIAIIAPFS